MKTNNGYISAQKARELWNTGESEFKQEFSLKTGKYTNARLIHKGITYRLNDKNMNELKRIINNK